VAATLAVAIALVLLLPGTGTAATERTNSAGWQYYSLAVFDVVAVRPLGVLALAAGMAFVVPVALVTWPSGRDTIDEAIERFVKVPANDVFVRPLGDF
jgi:hypothetical protein